ncbi:interleukin-3 receptor subunit alpha isoform X2 [Prionailurus viverrinus]|uniref:interleukin-3 receptor subunit alpha isoform X2 n=1 Tax=Prionailurus viverrinus TaxID=61388 RepID=UPI001FF5D416|nr:interleukin-3 receptor subunit alpha isoform X2 [Prionailurus viverrinus]
MAFLWLALCLTPACCLLHKDEDPEPPIKNLRMQPETRRLTWDLSGNVSEISCFINSRLITKVTNFTVASTGDPPFSAGILYPRPEGHREAAAQRLGCWVHDVDFLTCSWEAGRAAPGDVQYRLYWRDLKTYEEEECPRYGVDDRGTHIRCHFDDVSGLGEHVQFLVKGTGKGARIPCSDLTVELAGIERLSLPNITGMCNKSYSIMEWKMSSHFNHRFTYELEIQKGSDSRLHREGECPPAPHPPNSASGRAGLVLLRSLRSPARGCACGPHSPLRSAGGRPHGAGTPPSRGFSSVPVSPLLSLTRTPVIGLRAPLMQHEPPLPSLTHTCTHLVSDSGCNAQIQETPKNEPPESRAKAEQQGSFIAGSNPVLRALVAGDAERPRVRFLQPFYRQLQTSHGEIRAFSQLQSCDWLMFTFEQLAEFDWFLPLGQTTTGGRGISTIGEECAGAPSNCTEVQQAG